MQEDIATIVSGKLRGGLSSEEKTRLNKSQTTNAGAYQLYLKGRYHANQATAAGLKKSIEFFQEAIDKDPGYALAYAGLAMPTLNLEAHGFICLQRTVFQRNGQRQ